MMNMEEDLGITTTWEELGDFTEVKLSEFDRRKHYTDFVFGHMKSYVNFLNLIANGTLQRLINNGKILDNIKLLSRIKSPESTMYNDPEPWIEPGEEDNQRKSS